MNLLSKLHKGTIIFGVLTVLYLLIVIAKADEPDGGWRIGFLVALVAITGLFQASALKLDFDLATFFKYMHLLLAIVYFWGAAFGKWAKRGDPDEGVLSAQGGTGFGRIAVILGVILLGLAIMRLRGQTKVLPGLGVEQLTVIVGFAAWMNILAFIVGWLATFEAGTGWGVVVAYFPASLIPQLAAITLSATEPATSISELEATKRRTFSLIALLGGIGVAAFPFLAWLNAGSITLSALDGTSEGAPSGPRFGYMLLIFGVVTAIAALMRMRPQGLAEPGPNALIGHVLMGLGLVTVLVPVATLISVLRLDIDVGPGIGLWLGLLAGLVLVGVAVIENRTRGAVAA